MHDHRSPPPDPRPLGVPARAAFRRRSGGQRHQPGFTLVELITVLLVLSVLAAVALPRFTSLQGKAREAKVRAIAGAMTAAASLAKSSAMANRVACTAATGTAVVMEGVNIDLNHCYPQAQGNFSQGILGAAQVLATDDWVLGTSTGGATPGSVLTIQLSNAWAPDNCSVTYTSSSAAGAAPTIMVTSSGC